MPWLVDGMNVIGSVPDGWWRDRTAAMRRLLAALGPLAATEGPVELVLDGRERDLGPVPDGVTVTWAPQPGPDAADRLIAARVREAGGWTVATSDGALADAVREAGATVVGARAFRRRLDGTAGGQT